MLFDTHTHINLGKLPKREKEILENLQKNNVKYFCNIGTNLETSKKSVEIAKKTNNFATVGIHPCDVYELDLQKSMETLEKYILEDKKSSIIPFEKGDENNKNNRIVGIGECGLDYYWLKSKNDKTIAKYEKSYQEKIISLRKKLQKIFFKAQIELAKKYDLPVVIHNRESKEDIFEILKETNFKNFIFHCYSEDLEYAKKLLDFAPNCKISFSGIVTFKNAKNIQETAKNIPLKNILIETDAPYLTPSPFRGKCENEPSFVKYVLEKIIELRDENPLEIENQIFKNSLEIYKIKDVI